MNRLSDILPPISKNKQPRTGGVGGAELPERPGRRLRALP